MAVIRNRVAAVLAAALVIVEASAAVSVIAVVAVLAVIAVVSAAVPEAALALAAGAEWTRRSSVKAKALYNYSTDRRVWVLSFGMTGATTSTCTTVRSSRRAGRIFSSDDNRGIQ